MWLAKFDFVSLARRTRLKSVNDSDPGLDYVEYLVPAAFGSPYIATVEGFSAPILRFMSHQYTGNLVLTQFALGGSHA